MSVIWGAHAIRVLVSATRRNAAQEADHKRLGWRVAIASRRVACAPGNSFVTAATAPRKVSGQWSVVRGQRPQFGGTR
jgi:hypothetical protein